MKCPVCSNTLCEYNAGSFRVDICRDGCSGIWFDKEEFDKCDQYNEPFPDQLLRVRKVPDVVIDRSKVRSCPKCPDTKLTRVVLDADVNLEIDHCPKCEGTWLDNGELEYIRKDDKECAAIEARIAGWNKRINEELSNVDSANRVKAFVGLIFGKRY